MLASSLRNTLNSLSGIKSFKLEIEVKSSSSPLELDMNPDSTVPDDVVVTSGVVATIEYTPEVVKRRQVLHILHSIAAASETPFDITLVGGQQAAEDRLSRRREIAHARNRFLISLAFAIPALFFGMIFMFIHEVEMHLMTEVTTGISISAIIQFIIATPVQFWLGAEFYVKTYKSLRRLRPTMEVLIALGTSAAYFYSIFSIILRMATGTTKVDLFFETSVLLICFLLLGRFLELLAKGRTSQAVGKLLSLQANDATVVVVDNATGEITSEETIEIDLLERGDLLKVLPGAKVPADGTVLIGDTMVDESMITGESLPVQKKAGSTVLGGTVNQQSMFLMKLTKTGTDTALSKIVQLARGSI
jgi:Cu+-exporting ATPase